MKHFIFRYYTFIRAYILPSVPIAIVNVFAFKFFLSSSIGNPPIKTPALSFIFSLIFYFYNSTIILFKTSKIYKLSSLVGKINKAKNLSDFYLYSSKSS